VNAIGAAIKEITGIETELSTSGGTSDGRFIADICPQVIEFGPLNATIHKLNECVSVTDLEILSKIYYRTLVNLLVNKA
jgi:succinyl-diaminopimelate desuccinylase